MKLAHKETFNAQQNASFSFRPEHCYLDARGCFRERYLSRRAGLHKESEPGPPSPKVAIPLGSKILTRAGDDGPIPKNPHRMALLNRQRSLPVGVAVVNIAPRDQ